MSSDKTQKLLNKFGTMMICYALVSLLMLVLRGWTQMDLILFIVNVITFCLFQFTKIDKKIPTLLAIVYGLVSLFLLSGIIIFYGLFLSIYSLILFINLMKK